MEVYHLSDVPCDGSRDGENHLHVSTSSCTNVFVSPNKTGLKGIAPHIHDECDDIEFLATGEIALFRPWQNALAVRAPALLISTPGQVHGFYTVGADPVRVLGFRSPANYQGRSMLGTSSCELESLSLGTSSQCIDLSDMEATQIETANTTIKIHRLAAGVAYIGSCSCERIVIFLGSGLARHSGSEVYVKAAGFLVLGGGSDLTCELSSDSTLVELVPRRG